MGHGSQSDARDGPAGLARRDFLKVGAGFSLALTLAASLPGGSDAGKAPAQGFAFPTTRPC